jgi:hypothetical protein
MYSQSGLHHEIAQDRQQQVLMNAGVHHRAVPHVAELAAHGRARATRVAATVAPSFAWFPGRLRRSLRPDLQGI